MASHPSRRGSNFCRFFGLGRRKNNDILGIYFVRNNCVFSDAPEPVQNKIPKKVTFLGNFPGYIFHHVSFSWLCFYTVLSGWSTTSAWASEKRHFFGAKKCHFFGKNDVFSRETIRCFLAAALSLRKRIPYLSANRLEPRISRDQHIQTCQFKTTNVKIHPGVLKVYTHLISFGQMEMANASENFGNTLVGLKPWTLEWCNPRLPQECPKRFFGHLKKCCFFGPRLSDDGPKKSWLSGWLAIWLAGCLSSWLAIWLARWLAGYLAIGFVAGWLPIWLLAIWLAGWLADWHWLWLSLWMDRSLACYLAI